MMRLLCSCRRIIILEGEEEEKKTNREWMTTKEKHIKLISETEIH